MTPETIIVADDHPLFRDALRQAIEGLETLRKVEMAGDLTQVEALLRRDGDAELVLLDLNMPGNSGFAGLLMLRSAYPGVPVVIVSATEDAATVRRALDLGASGYIPKSSTGETIREAIGRVLEGEIWVPPDIDLDSGLDGEERDLAARLRSLTPQQHRVLSMLGEGLLNKQIAHELGVSEATVKAHVSAVLLKLGVDSRTQAVIAMARIGLASPASDSSS